MLVLSRKPGEKIYIGNDISVTIVEVHGNRVKVGIEAPANKRVLRGELAFWMDAPETKEPAKTEKKKECGAIADTPMIRQAACSILAKA